MSPKEARLKVYVLAINGHRPSLIAQTLWAEECQTKNGYNRAYQRVYSHIKWLLARQYISPRYYNRNTVGYEKGNNYREFEQKYIAEGLDPMTDRRVGGYPSEIPCNIHHDRWRLVINDMKDFDVGDHPEFIPFSPQIHPPHYKTEPIDISTLPRFRLILRLGETKSISLYVLEPIIARDKRTFIESARKIEQRAWDIRNWLCKTYRMDIGMPEQSVERHYAFEVSPDIVAALKKTTDPSRDDIWGDNSPHSKGHIETHSDIVAWEIKMLPKTVEGMEVFRGRAEQNIDALHSRIKDLEAGLIKTIKTIKVISGSVEAINKRQESIVKSMETLVGAIKGDNPTETAIDPLREPEEDNTNHYIG